MYDMGSKSASKEIMIAAGVPVTPGYHGADQSVERFQKEAEEMGFPVILKAVMGGGKGMRIVHKAEDLAENLEMCRNEAIKSFKDDQVLVERYLTNPRHIEFQVFADTQGNCVHLYERDCSVQRRHQKVLEEAPAPFMTEEQRAKMGKAAIDAALAVGYVGAGTVEFMLDTDGRFYFMEMNTRLQVEHPVTEAITNVDLVEWQLKVASGHPLPMTQDEIKIDGWAIEARVYAEDPDNDFLPAAGPIHHMCVPATDTTGLMQAGSVRVDTGVVQGDDVSIYYDPMISKLVTKADTRDTALKLMAQALEQYRIVGLPSNIGFLRRAVQHPAFLAGGVDTNFIEEHMHTLLPQTPNEISARALAVAVFATLAQERHAASAAASATQEPQSPWNPHRGGYSAGRVTGLQRRDVAFIDAGSGEKVTVPAELRRDGSVLLYPDGGDAAVEVQGQVAEDGHFTVTVGVSKVCGSTVEIGKSMYLFVEGDGNDVETEHMYRLDTAQTAGGADAAAGSGTSAAAPMPGKVVKMMVKVGDEVAENDALVIVEAMKMEHVIRVPADSVITAVHNGEGDFVDGDEVLVEFEPLEAKKE